MIGNGCAGSLGIKTAGSTPESIAKPLIKFWSELEDTVHPRDKQVLNRYPEAFKTEYPPPAYIGDIISARIFLLWANGGYHPERTVREFESPGSVEAFRDRLRNPRPWTTLRFKAQPTLRKWLETGNAAIINAMGYRSEKLTRQHRAIADELPSVQFHRKWFHSHLLPACGRVMIIVHRPRLWKLRKDDLSTNHHLLFTDNPASGYLPNWVTERGEEFIAGARQAGSL